MTKQLPRGVRRLFSLPASRETLERDADEEMLFHIEMWKREFRARGLSDADADDQARRRFGDSLEYREYAARRAAKKARWQRMAEWGAEWAQDVRFALRHFRKTPAFTAIAILTLALGIGANTAIFSVVHRMLIAPLPYPNGDRVVALRLKGFGHGGFVGLASMSLDQPFNPPSRLVGVWASRAHSLDMIAGAGAQYLALDANNRQDTLSHVFITANFLPMLGAKPALGRVFRPEEELSINGRVAMISYGWWQRAYSGRPEALGQTMDFEGRRYTIVGVMPRGFSLPMTPRQLDAFSMPSADMWLPASIDSVDMMFGRLRSGTTAADATRELDAITGTAGPMGPRFGAARDSVHALAMRAQDFLAPREVRTIEILFAAVGALLLIACANVANLLLVRAWTRRREFAVRVGLGAGRARLVRLALTESILLALVAGAIGMLIAWQGLRVIIATRPLALDNLATVSIEPVVLFWTAAISILTGILFGGAAALFVSSQNVADLLRNETRASSAAGASRRVRSSLIVLEVALSFALLVSAGLLARSFAALQETPLGFNPRGLVSIDILYGPVVQRTAPNLLDTRAAIVERLRRVPGVADAAIGTLPTAGFAFPDSLLMQTPDGERRLGIGHYLNTWVDENYFRASGVHLIAGRAPMPGATDDIPGQPVRGVSEEIVVNRTFARRIAPNGNAVGMHIRVAGPFAANNVWSTIVGVAEDVRLPGARSNVQEHQLYTVLPRRLSPTFIVRFGAAVPPDAESVLRSAIQSVYPTLVARRTRLAQDYVREAMAPTRFMLALLGAFAIVAIVLATVGLYGAIAYTVTQRTREIGIRIALGARPSAVTQLVIRDGLWLVGAGLAIGVITAAASTRALASLLYGVPAGDPATFGAIALLVGIVALVASYVPARRAVRIDPVDALRAD